MAILLELIQKQSEDIQALRDEIAKLGLDHNIGHEVPTRKVF